MSSNASSGSVSSTLKWRRASSLACSSSGVAALIARAPLRVSSSRGAFMMEAARESKRARGRKGLDRGFRVVVCYRYLLRKCYMIVPRGGAARMRKKRAAAGSGGGRGGGGAGLKAGGGGGG